MAQAAQALRPDCKPGVKTIVVTRHCPREMYRSIWSVDQFVLANKLGGGYASTVHLAICKATGTQVAIKVYHRCKLSQLNNYQVQREIRIHSCLDHRNVLQLSTLNTINGSVLTVAILQYAAFEDQVGVYLVTEYASRGDVFGELDRRGGSMTEADAVRQVLSPFLSALEYLHALNIIHRDIKPENLLFTASGVLKVADFGLSIDVTQERPVTRVGTLDYMAPEVVICPDKCHPNDHKEKTQLHYTHLVDAWAVGVLAYELTVGRAPFDAGNKRGTIENILGSQPRFPAWISDGARHFVNFSLTKDIAKRPGIQQLAEHPWIHQYAGGSRSNAINSLRAVSCHNLPMYNPNKAAAAPQHRHKLMEQAVESQQDRLVDLQEDEDDVFVSASGEGQTTAADVPAAISTSTHPAVASEVVALQQRAATFANTPAGLNCSPGRPVAVPQAATAAASITVTTLPPAGVSPFAAAAATPASTGASPNPLRGVPVLGAAANKLRAFVHSYRSANDLDSLKAFMLQQPPEPSNACFEPGGRFYPGSQAATAASGGGAAADAAPKPAVHDSAASLGSSSSSSSSSSRGQPKAPAGANHLMAGFVSPKPLQLVKLPANLCQMPKSDSCRSLQGLTHIVEGKAEGKDSSMGGGPVPMSPGSKACSLAGNGASSPMPTSPAAAKTQGLRLKQHELAQRERSVGAQDRADSASTSSCSCSSSCESGLHGSSGSVSSCHSWGYQQQGAEQYQAPQPPTPPCKVSRNAYSPFSPAADAAQIHPSSGGGNQQQGSVVPVGFQSGLNPGSSGGRTPSCQDFEHFLSQCKPGHAVQVGTATGKRSLVSLAADCRGPGQQQQPIGPGEMLAQGPMEQANGCFGFLKSPRR